MKCVLIGNASSGAQEVAKVLAAVKETSLDIVIIDDNDKGQKILTELQLMLPSLLHKPIRIASTRAQRRAEERKKN